MNSEQDKDGVSQNETQGDTPKSFLDHESFTKFYEKFSGKIKDAVTASAKVPLKENDLEYFRTVGSFNSFMQNQNDRILRLMGQFLKQQNIKKSNFHSNKLEDEERMDLLIDINDQMIEKLGIQLDEIQGLRKKTETELKLSSTTLNATSRNINTSWNKEIGMVVNKTMAQSLYKSDSKINAGASGSDVSQFSHKKGAMPKPQLSFKDKLDNSNLPFIPKIRHKHNALRPLPEIFTKLTEMNLEITQEIFEENLELLENPYLFEIEQLELNEEEFKLNQEPVEKPLSLEKANYKYIDKVEDLIELCDYLGKNNRSKIKEISVDLEHHSYRSFLGFTCLMQISTREDDFLIDTLKLRSEMHRLNEIFTDWTLLKILHGADFDIEWLQKDFGIYVVNMFDTGQAARVLQYPHFSLSYLLQKFCGISAQKQFQLADWRQRPLSDEMIRYAREDTRYLLYIYDCLKQELLGQLNKNENLQFSQSSLAIVFEKSKAICKKSYKKPVFYTKGFLNLCQNNSHLNPKQMKALQDLYKWRDRIARETDESTEFVLKNHQLLKIAELLPREIYGILALCNPISSIVETNVHEIHEIVKTAREFTGTLNSFELNESEKSLSNLLDKGSNAEGKANILDTLVHSVTYDPNSILNCPHDFPHSSENSMEVEADQIKSNLSDLLLKPKQIIEEILPNDLISTEKSELKNFFTKTSYKNENVRKVQKIEEKIKEIQESIKNPFELFLPSKFRTNKSESNFVWNLLQSSNKQNQATVVQVKEEATVEETQADVFMIPLKKQFKMEKHSESKKLKKKLKNVDFSDAIIEFNKSRAERIEALGADEEEQEKLDKISEKVKENLNSLSQFVKKANINKKVPGNSEQTQEEFKYDPSSMNQMFSKPEKAQNDQANKTRRVDNKFGKVNKRRATNAVTRNKHNKSHTFKTSQ